MKIFTPQVTDLALFRRTAYALSIATVDFARTHWVVVGDDEVRKLLLLFTARFTFEVVTELPGWNEGVNIYLAPDAIISNETLGRLRSELTEESLGLAAETFLVPPAELLTLDEFGTGFNWKKAESYPALPDTGRGVWGAVSWRGKEIPVGFKTAGRVYRQGGKVHTW